MKLHKTDTHTMKKLFRGSKLNDRRSDYFCIVLPHSVSQSRQQV